MKYFSGDLNGSYFLITSTWVLGVFVFSLVNLEISAQSTEIAKMLNGVFSKYNSWVDFKLRVTKGKPQNLIGSATKVVQTGMWSGTSDQKRLQKVRQVVWHKKLLGKIARFNSFMST